ncbi:WD40/YVTN/BNR-like repeat-containing protein [Nocardioides currus]|uniref:Oxidoreductase n=1 Tax=Nocardioides currus TaxID=2133958 RepID=A0A2R7YXY1_9ACTN|nr:oxidoreductase [Nocardioides currus]PUA81240.1 oxidoreductase [Nocardioides currus]
MRTPLGLVALTLAASLTGSLVAPSSADTADRAEEAKYRWSTTVVDADQSFRGLDAVDATTAWVSGASLTDGGAAKVFLTTDAGATWQDVSPPDSEGLNFRDVEAEDALTASVLAIGEGEASRIYRTTDGGATWTETFRNTDPKAFFNCMDFSRGGKVGLAVSDPVGGKFQIARTKDRGRSWTVLDDRRMPRSTGEFNFSASGDCLVFAGRNAYFGSGGDVARVYRSTDQGRTWAASETTLPTGEAAGVFALAFRTPRAGVAVGGDFEAPDDGTDATALLRRGNRWTAGGDLRHLGEDASWSRGMLLVVGQGGEDGGSSISRDLGATWTRFSKAGFHTLDCYGADCWAAGGDGRVGTVRIG